MKLKTKFGKRVNLYLSNDVIGMLDLLTDNRSRYIENFIKSKYETKMKRLNKNKLRKL